MQLLMRIIYSYFQIDMYDNLCNNIIFFFLRKLFYYYHLLLAAAYKALYRADDFEFNRLKQSFWWDVIYNVSKSMSIEPLLHFFPMEAEDIGFTRAKEPYECGKFNPHRCGPGTKRIPKTSC